MKLIAVFDLINHPLVPPESIKQMAKEQIDEMKQNWLVGMFIGGYTLEVQE